MVNLETPASQLMDYFDNLCKYLVNRFGFECLNERIIDRRYVVSKHFCYEWLEGEVLGLRNKRQQFGSFFDVGHAHYCLHVQLGTINLHAGIVRIRREGDLITVLRMNEFDDHRIGARLVKRLPPALRLEGRIWGHRWYSINCGDFRNIGDNTFAQSVLDFEHGQLAKEVIQPLAEALRVFSKDRAWALQSFDRRQWFRFFVDGRFQVKYSGWRGYEEKEPFSVKCMLNAFCYILDNLNRATSLDIHYLLDLHWQCMNGVRSNNPKSTPGEVRFLEAGFHFYGANSTLASLAEVFDLRRGDGTALFHDSGYGRSSDQTDFIEVFGVLQKEGKLRYRPWYPNLTRQQQQLIETRDGSPEFLALKSEIQSKFVKKIEGCLLRYKEAIENAKHDVDRIYAIARLVRDLELLHPFPDGNARAFPVALAVQLLIYYGFPPPIYRDPNVDAELSYAEFAHEMILSMRNTMMVIKAPEANLFNYAIGDASQQDIDNFATLASGLSARIDLLNREESEGNIFATPDYVAWVTGGHWVRYRPDLRFSNTGSHRTFQPNCLYFGLAVPEWRRTGRSAEAELQRVIAKGVSALVLDATVDPGIFTIPVLVVDDLNAALKNLAHRVRSDVGCQTVCITGTEGKTGAKIQLHYLLRRQCEVHAVLNSANTEGPVLFSLANLKSKTRVEINEVSVGADEALRVERALLVSPDLCLFTNIGPNHMDMHKTIENVIIAKSSVVEGLPKCGTAIINAANEYATPLISAIRDRRPDVKIITYGINPGDNARLLEAQFHADRFGWSVKAEILGLRVDYFVPLLQNYAPLASIGVLLTVAVLGYNVTKAAQDYIGFTPYETMGRLMRLHLPDGDVLFYDQSRRGGLFGMRSAFDDLSRFPDSSRVVALVGGISIKRDGEWTRKAHGELAELINRSRIRRLLTTGSYMEYVHSALQHPDCLIGHSDDIDELAERLVGELRPGDVLFIIGSAYLYLGRVSDRLLQWLPHSLLAGTEVETC